MPRLPCHSLGEAIREGTARDVRMQLLRGARIKPRYLLAAAEQGDAKKVAALMKHAPSEFPAEMCQDGMVKAIKVGHTEIVRVLLEAGISPNFANSDCHAEETPLHMAVRFEQIEVVELLLQHKANVNQRDGKGCTPLYEHTNHLVVRLLIQHGANPNVVNNTGRTPLHLMCGECDLAAAKALKGADPNAHDANHATPLHYCCASGNLEMIKWLIHRAGANPQPLTEENVFMWADPSLSAKDLIDLGINPMQRDSQGNTVFHAIVLTTSETDEEKVVSLFNFAT